MLECEWVKAHTDPPNPYNNEVDKLAKEGNDEDIFEFNTKFLDSTHHVLNWSGIPIDMKARNFVKHIVKAKTLTIFLIPPVNKKSNNFSANMKLVGN